MYNARYKIWIWKIDIIYMKNKYVDFAMDFLHYTCRPILFYTINVCIYESLKYVFIKFMPYIMALICDYVYYFVSTENPIVILDYMKRFSFQAILNASVSVDSFFLLRYLDMYAMTFVCSVVRSFCFCACFAVW